jgi:Raf kinase inhibitor-like YbhB/YbcL family protein
MKKQTFAYGIGIFVLALVMVALQAVAETSAAETTPPPPQLTLQSAAYNHETAMPARFTCEGEDVSPPLSWLNVPEKTQSLALIIDDPDAPDPAKPTKTVVHWVVYNIPPSVNKLDEGIKKLPEGAVAGANDMGNAGYKGPCPPIGEHRYFHKLFALDTVLKLPEKADKAKLLEAMEGHTLAQTVLIGKYQKVKPSK